MFDDMLLSLSPRGFSPVVKVRGWEGGSAPLLPFEPLHQYNPLIEFIKCYFMPK